RERRTRQRRRGCDACGGTTPRGQRGFGHPGGAEQWCCYDRPVISRGERMKAMMIGAVAAAAIASAGAAAQAAQQPASTQAVHKAALLKRVSVSAKEFKFIMSSKTAKRGVVVFKVTHTGKIQHDFKIKGRKTRLLSH